MSAPRASAPSVLIYKVMGKMFAVLSIRRIENVILKCDPELGEALREQYAGVGHRSHLDRRHFTRKQQAELASATPRKRSAH